ncbi:MAG: hypothetical protein QG552_2230 [Thermodesulfobacteriota bacterium]|nr:hypothetical protein [Thermodesulfobacteriota bacterium]
MILTFFSFKVNLLSRFFHWKISEMNPLKIVNAIRGMRAHLPRIELQTCLIDAFVKIRHPVEKRGPEVL